MKPTVIRRTPQYDSLYTKRGIVTPIMHLSEADYIEHLSEIFSLTHEVDDYALSVTAEPDQLPIPHTFELSEPHKKIMALFDEHYSEFLDLTVKRRPYELQAVERRSRVGFPYLSFFLKGSDKRDLIIASHRDKNLLEKSQGPVIINKRLQPESLDKERTFQFLDVLGRDNASMQITERVVGKDYRKTNYEGVYGSRPRLVFNYPVPTLVNQLVDGHIHDCYMKYPCFHHDMTSFPYDSNDSDIESIETDIAHYERTIGIILMSRARIIGGRYFDFTKFLLDRPYICKGSDNLTYELDYKNLNVQMGSGISAVAPAGKEVNFMVTAKVYSQLKDITFKKAADILLNHKDPEFMLLQFGDDEKMVYRKSNKEFAMNLFEKKCEMLPSKIEDPPKFLGYRKYVTGSKTRNRLTVKSCFLNFFLDERAPGSTFRKYPNYGYFERCNAYSKLGYKDCLEYLEKEQKLLKKLGWFKTILDLAPKEKARAGQMPVNYVLGKNYLLTKQELAALGEDTVIPASIVEEAVKMTNLTV